MTDLPTNAPSPRLCHIVKWPDFDGYGFNLHAEKVRQGQFIGKVDEKSPADVSGLKEGDRIVEVNGVNISNENHKQVVQRIKAVSNETRLLVIDATGDEWYKDHNIVIRGDQPNIIYGTSKRSPLPENNHHDQPSSEETQSNKSNTIETPPPPAHEEDRKSVGSSSCHSENSNQPQQEDSAQKEDEVVITVKPPTSSSADKEDICSSESDPRDDGDGNVPSTETPCTTENRPLEIPTIETPSPEPPCTEDTVEESSTKSDPILEYDNVRFESEEEQKKEEEPIPPLKDSPPPTPPRESPLPSEDRRSLSSSASGGSCEKAKPQSDGGLDAPPPEAESEQPEETRKSPMSTTPSPPPSLNPDGSIASQQNSTTENSTAPSTHSGLNLNMTAAEMRAHLATRKKFDPRNDQIDLKKKYQIVQNM